MELAKAYAADIGKKLGDVAQPLRAALSGKSVSPGVFEVMEILGKEESLGRLKDALN
jgi:glutamyl-tRNA synthetase